MASLLGKQTKKKSKPRSSIGDRGEGINWLPILALLAVIFSSLSLLGTLFIGAGYWKIAQKKQPTLVQTVDGEAITTTEDEHLYRSVATIRKFVRSELSMLLTWTGNTVDEDGLVIKDKGIEWNGRKISSRTYEAQFGLSVDDGFREDIMDLIASWHTPDYLTGNKTQTLEIKHIYRPKEIEPGRWSVGVVASRTISVGANKEYTRFNRTLYIQAVEPQTDPLPDTATAEQKAFYRIRKAGLQIYAMRGFSGEDL